MRMLLALVLLSVSVAAQSPAPATLPAAATAKLAESLKAAGILKTNHLWRDVPPLVNGLVHAYIEIPAGERNKQEFDMRRNALGLDRIIPESIGGYPVNYGFVPQTISYDGDPSDVLVLGPPRRAGEIVTGRIVGLMLMEDEKGLDSKVVITPAGIEGTSTHTLTAADMERIAAFFRIYKKDQPAAWSKVPGWGTAADGLSHVTTTHQFFLVCRELAGKPCVIARK
jgi:inorganic pyrophosphatase